MPSQDCVRCEQSPNLLELLATENLPFDGQAATLVIGQQDSPFNELLHQNSTLGFELINPLLLLSVPPIGNDQQE